MEKAWRSCYNNSKAKGGKDNAKSYNIYFGAAGFAGGGCQRRRTVPGAVGRVADPARCG